MKITKLSITGLHSQDHKVYEFSDANYIYGPNGSGKSSVLYGIQLALLGYIPGYNKKNGDIFKHAASSIMTMELYLQDNSNEQVKITRTFMRKGKSVTSEMIIQPENYNLSSILSDIELPVYNFDEFINQSDNALKSWFMSMMSSNYKLDIGKELKDAACASNIVADYKDLLDEVLEDYNEICKTSSNTIERLKSFETRLKQLLSLKKQMLSDVQSTVDTLTIDENDNLEFSSYTPEERDSKIAMLKSEIIELTELRNNIQIMSSIKNQLSAYSDVPESETDQRSTLDRYDEKIAEITFDLDKLYVDSQEIANARMQLSTELENNNKIISGNGICPYTESKCDKIVTILPDIQHKIELLNKSIKDKSDDATNISNKINDYKFKLSNLKDEKSKLEATYHAYNDLNTSLQAVTSKLVEATYKGIATSEDISQTIDMRQAELDALQSDVVKAQANQRYNDLISKYIERKYKLELDIQIIKIWMNHVGPKGLQTSCMMEQVHELSTTFNTYMDNMLGTDVTSEFRISPTSFSFGIVRNDKYIEFELLSSGEKCLFLLAFLTYLVDKLDSKLRCILVDGRMFDSLDDNNRKIAIDYILNNSHKCQYVITGTTPTCREHLNSIELS